MRFTNMLAAAAAAQVAVASPIEKRQMALSANDIFVVQLAHFLENLEFNLYTGGFKAFSEEQFQAAGFPRNFSRSVQLISSVCRSSSSTIDETNMLRSTRRRTEISSHLS